MAFQDRPMVQLVNTLIFVLRKLGWSPIDFQPESVERMARRATGLDDFGSPDYREPLEQLCLSYRNDADLTPFGQSFCFRTLVHMLSNRAMLHRDLKEQPEILEQPVRRPLFVVGLPRTGTTLLYNLLALDPQSRPLMYWESMQPSPPPDPATYATDPRIRRARRQTWMLSRALPRVRGMHEFRPDVPEECVGLLLNTLVFPFFHGRIPEYRAWLAGIPDAVTDHVYREYRAQLQVLQWKVSADHWVLKCPAHLFGLGGLLSAFPDGAVIQTHRELAKSVPSFCNMTAEFETLIYRRTDRLQVGHRVVDSLQMLLDRGLAARDQFDGEPPIFDVRFDDLVQDPLKSVRVIYDRFGYDYTDEFDRRLKHFQSTDAHAAKARHRYSLEEFGLSHATLEEKFGAYAERFQLAARTNEI